MTAVLGALAEINHTRVVDAQFSALDYRDTIDFANEVWVVNDRTEPQATISFHYLKADGHRTIHVDGAHGGINPQGDLAVSLYCERFPIPQEQIHPVELPSGRVLDPAISTKGKVGIIREIEVTMHLTLASAKLLGEFLIKKADEIQALKDLSHE